MGDNHYQATPEVAKRLGPYMSVNAVAEYIDVDPRTVRLMIADGRLKAYRLGRRVIRLRRAEVEAAFEPFGGAA